MSLPSRQKLTQSGKYQVVKRKKQDFVGMFPEECIAPQNTPRENGFERPDSWPLKRFPVLKNANWDCHNERSVSQTEVIGGCGRLSVSPNMDLKVMDTEKRLPPIATVRDWREISPDLLKRDAAWNVLCKHCPKIGLNSRKQYYQRILQWRKGITGGKCDKNCTIHNFYKVSPPPMVSDPRVLNEYDRMITHQSYVHPFYQNFQRTINNSRSNKSPDMQLTRKKNLLERSKCSTTLPAPPIVERTLSHGKIFPGTPDTEYCERKLARYLNLYKPQAKSVHNKCRPLDKIFEPAYQNMTDPLRLVYKRKALPGLLQKKTNTNTREKKTFCVSEEFKCNGDIGVSFRLPDYNSNLGKRHVSIPRNTNLTRSYESQIRRKLQIERTISMPQFPSFPIIITTKE